MPSPGWSVAIASRSRPVIFYLDGAPLSPPGKSCLPRMERRCHLPVPVSHILSGWSAAVTSLKDMPSQDGALLSPPRKTRLPRMERCCHLPERHAFPGWSAAVTSQKDMPSQDGAPLSPPGSGQSCSPGMEGHCLNRFRPVMSFRDGAPLPRPPPFRLCL